MPATGNGDKSPPSVSMSLKTVRTYLKRVLANNPPAVLQVITASLVWSSKKSRSRVQGLDDFGGVEQQIAEAGVGGVAVDLVPAVCRAKASMVADSLHLS